MAILNKEPIDLYYEIHGQGDPLLLIHGLGSSSQDWELQITRFVNHFQIITVDLRGHGKSPKPPGPYSMTLFAEDVAELLGNLGHSSVHMLGISLGGMVAFQLALDYPELVQSLVVVNSTPEMILHSLKDRIALWQRLMIVRLMGMQKMGKVLAERFLPGPEFDELRQVFVKRWAQNHKPAYLEAMKAVVGWSVLERLGEINCPALILGSDGDYFPMAEKEAYTRRIPGAKLTIIKNSRHALPAEKPEEFNDAVELFLLGVGN